MILDLINLLLLGLWIIVAYYQEPFRTAKHWSEKLRFGLIWFQIIMLVLNFAARWLKSMVAPE
jgi:hypothetical protein